MTARRPVTPGLGDRMRAARELAGLKQAEVADAAGLARSQVANLEIGNSDPSLSSLMAFARVTGVPVGALVGEIPMPELPSVKVRTTCVVECARCGPLDGDPDLAYPEALKRAADHRREHLAGHREDG